MGKSKQNQTHKTINNIITKNDRKSIEFLNKILNPDILKHTIRYFKGEDRKKERLPTQFSLHLVLPFPGTPANVQRRVATALCVTHLRRPTSLAGKKMKSAQHRDPERQDDTRPNSIGFDISLNFQHSHKK